MTISPYEQSHFAREGVVDINAAVVGVGRTSWIHVSEQEATLENAARMMRSEQIDILPVVNGSRVTKYFRTRQWNDYSSISEETIRHGDAIPFTTHIRDVIRGFALEDRKFYFLQNERRIVGLISVVNLNCRQVKVYLFSLLTELEVHLSTFLSQHIPDDQLLKMTFGDEEDGQEKDKHSDVKQRYFADKKNGVDLPIMEYLYLSDLISVITKLRLYEQLGYSNRQFQKDLGSLNALRNQVAHPTRSIIVDECSPKRLWRRIDRIEEALFVLDAQINVT